MSARTYTTLPDTPKVPNDIILPNVVNRPGNSDPRYTTSLSAWVKQFLASNGYINRNTPCCSCQFYYTLTGGTYPATLTSIVIDTVVTALSGPTINSNYDIVTILNTLGIGQFSYTPATGQLCVPSNHTFGNIVTSHNTWTLS